MNKKEGFVLIIVLFSIAINLTNLYINYNFGLFDTDNFFTGKSLSTGSVVVFVEESIPTVYIYSPANITYNFSKTDTLQIQLNVTSANFEPVTWYYDLYDLNHNILVNDSIGFSPNTTIAVVRWGNNLTVYAEDSGGNIYSSSVVFYVNVPNSAPLLGDIDSRIYVCETERINYTFNATDIDEDTLTPDISPKNPFYVAKISQTGGNMSARIFSGFASVCTKMFAIRIESVWVFPVPGPAIIISGP